MATDECLGAQAQGRASALIQNGDWGGILPQPTKNTTVPANRIRVKSTAPSKSGTGSYAPLDRVGEMVTCFSCHDTPAILAAVGLELADLFPERIKDPSPEARQRAREAFRRDGWRAALGVLARECIVVLAAAGMLRQGQALTADDDNRLTLAMQRIEDAREVLA